MSTPQEGFQLTPDSLEDLRREFWPDELCERFVEGPAPDVGVIMGSDSDLRVMQHAIKTLDELEVSHETGIVSAHRTPNWMALYGFIAARRGLKIIIAGAGGSAHLPGDIASLTRLPVVGIAIEKNPDPLNAALGSMLEMPQEGGPLGVSGKEKAGAVNAALLAGRILSLFDPELAERVDSRMATNAKKVGEKHIKLMNMGIEAFPEFVEAVG